MYLFNKRTYHCVAFIIERRKKKMNKNFREFILAAFCLALCMVLPLLTGEIPQIGSALSPMHIPVLLCGFVCGPFFAAVVGLIAPPLRFLIFGMPPIFPTGVAMSFELLIYGLISGLLYKYLPKKKINIYISLIAAMLVGRVVWGIVRLILSGVGSSSFTLSMFMSGAFITAVPGIILHIVLIPIIVIALQRAKVMKD